MKSGIVVLFGLTVVPGVGPAVLGRADDRQDGLAALRRHARGLEHVPGVLSGRCCCAGMRSRAAWGRRGRRAAHCVSAIVSDRARRAAARPGLVCMPPIALDPTRPTRSRAGDPATGLLGILCGLGDPPAAPGLGDGPPGPALVRRDRTSPGSRSLLPLRREQRRQPARRSWPIHSSIEPNLSLAAQARLWRTGFLILAISLLACGLVARG